MNWNGTKIRWIAALMLVTLPGITRVTRAAVLTNEWTFDEADGQSAPQVSDLVGSDSGTFVNMSDANRSADVPPRIGSTRSLSFAGGAPHQTVTLASQIALTNSSDWSVSVWYKGTDPGVNIVAGTNFGSVLLGRDDGDIYANLVIYNGKFAYDHWNNPWQQLTSTTIVDDNRWHLLTLVHYANETADIYVDGIQEVSHGDATDGGGPLVPYRIDGFMEGYSNHYTQGLLDDAQIYSGTLTESEVGELMAPEPASLSLLAAGGFLLMRRRTRVVGGL